MQSRPALERLTFLDHINVYLLETPRGPVLIDSAAPGMVSWLRTALRKTGLLPKDVAAVVLTHCHIDHVGTAGFLADAGVPLYALSDEIPILTGAQEHPGYGGLGGRILRVAERVVFPPQRFVGLHPLDPDETIFDTQWRVLAAPGHTPGSLALHNEETGDLLSGDTLVTDFNWPRGPHPLFTANLPRAMRSALELLNRGAARIHPGHGRPMPTEAFSKARRTMEQELARIHR